MNLSTHVMFGMAVASVFFGKPETILPVAVVSYALLRYASSRHLPRPPKDDPTIV